MLLPKKLGFVDVLRTVYLVEIYGRPCREMELKIYVDDEWNWTSPPIKMPKNYQNVDFILGISDERECLSEFFPGAEVRNIALNNRSP